MRIAQVSKPEYDACAVYAAVLKDPAPQAAQPLWVGALDALQTMEHRAGKIDGQSDGAGLLVSRPRHLWNLRLSDRPLNRNQLWYLTLAIPLAEERSTAELVRSELGHEGFSVISAYWDVIDGDEGLWSAALELNPRDDDDRRFVAALERLERALPGRVASFDRELAVLKCRGDSQRLREYAHKLWGDGFHPRLVVGHNRFSTNTATSLMRVQPFLGLAHNGEINTIDRVRSELVGLGVNPVREGSDSQSLDYALALLRRRWGLSLAETVRLLSAPPPSMVQDWPAEWQTVHAQVETLWPPVVQGPQALVVTDGFSLVAAVDAMGLRPLWVLETDTTIVVSSEPGIVPSKEWIAEPRIMGAGEVLAWTWEREGPIQSWAAESIQQSLVRRIGPQPSVRTISTGTGAYAVPLPSWRLAADGWTRDDLNVVKAWRETGQEPIGSLGFDGPLAALADGNVTVADHLHETVAVVTNPALDREREAEHFRLDGWIGSRPSNFATLGKEAILHIEHPWMTDQDLEAIAGHFPEAPVILPLHWPRNVAEIAASKRLGQTAQSAVRQGAVVLVLDDRGAYQPEASVGLDPALALAAVKTALREAGLDRQASIVVRSGSIRHLHDAAVLLGLGASALVPYALWGLMGDVGSALPVLNHGLEKIISTMGTHWLAGYGRNFSAIGLPAEVADLLGVPTFAAPKLEDWERRRQLIWQERMAVMASEEKPRFILRSSTHVYKAGLRMASGEISGRDFLLAVRAVEQQLPTQMRHVLRVTRHDAHPIAATSLKTGTHDYPFVISSMSFGSQGETAFRAYAEAARVLNIVSMNGEGGEIPDMIGQYAPWRGYQVASGRFGVNATLLNGARYVEIKIGQGAKPGEGGHLPGRKVSPKVAKARNAKPGIDLISPSNNHDLYSIEDLRQLVEELKAVNPSLRVVVKVPVVPNIGTIAVGIVKTGADVIALSGFDGGTGAARLHALRHAGLPVDIGVPLVHQALVQSGVRSRVELWADGGVRTSDDVLKLILLGADRVGFGTMAMVALGCTICRQCQKDTCHVGITTQIDSEAQAATRGVKRFQPQHLDVAVDHLTRFFQGLGEELASRLKHLGIASVREAVGQWQWLRQWGAQERLDFRAWVESLAEEDTLLSEVNGAAVPADRRAGSGADNGHRMRLAGVSQAGRLAARQAEWPEQVVVPGVAGQGFGAFLTAGLSCLAWGGAQDGVGKGASGGRIWVMKSRGLGGHVGKSLAYGAQDGTIIVQGGADARAGVRLAGARIVIMGDGLPDPGSGGWWESAAIKGFGFEYMTQGEAMVLADPGPWLAAGMTGGIIYLLHDPGRGLTEAFLRTRLSRGAAVKLQAVQSADAGPIQALLRHAVEALEASGQPERVSDLEPLLRDPLSHFLKVVPEAGGLDQQISTE